MKPFIILLSLLTLSVYGQQVTTNTVTVTNVVFVPVTLTGAAAVYWGNQFAAITNAAGQQTFPGPTLNAFFGAPGIQHTLTITSVNNPQGGTNLFTLTFNAQ
jgi:hypothetical protein